jgi:hypothetical protein
MMQLVQARMLLQNSRPEKRKMAESSKRAPGKGSKKKQQPTKSSKRQPKKKGAASAWTRDDQRYRYDCQCDS